LSPMAGQPPASSAKGIDFTEMDALIDTGAQRTVLALEAVQRVGLSKINEADLRVVGGIVRADVYVASMQFPHCHFSAIEVIRGFLLRAAPSRISMLAWTGRSVTLDFHL